MEPVDSVVERLSKRHDRAAFSCGNEALDRYLKHQAGQDQRSHVATVFVLSLGDGTIVGYYTLSATALRLSELPEASVRKLPRYPLVPAALLGRLAVDKRFRGIGHGRFLLADALHRVIGSDIASFTVVADAKDRDAFGFYEREGFLPLPGHAMRLFIPLSVVARLFADPD